MELVEPLNKNVVTFFDCQNLFGAVKNLWNYSFPNFDPVKLSKLIISNSFSTHCKLVGIRLYTGIHDISINPVWFNFWNKKLIAHRSQDPRVFFFTTPLRYSNNIPREKGVDIRIALDLVRMARLNEYDIAVLFSQDNDFSEVAEEIRNTAQERQRWIKIASAYPVNQLHEKIRGVNKTDWIKISKSEYDSCIDPTDYR
jgi:uncharacterized LabA/DUF88 family protein